MFPKKLLFIILIFSVLLLGFSNRIFALPNSTTIEIYQDLSKPLTNSNPNSLLIENNEVIILNNNLERLKLFNLSKSDRDVFITLVSGGNKLAVYKNGKRVNLISLNDINLSSLIANLQNSFNDGEITNLQISSFALSPKRVLKSYLDFVESNPDKHLKEKIVTDDSLKLYYSAANIDNMGAFATSSTTDTLWKDLSGNGNNGMINNFAFTTASGWDGNNTFSNPSKLTFDGINDYVEASNSTPFNFTATTPFTIEFWINAPSQPINSNQYILSKTANYSDPGYETTLLTTINGTFFFIRLGAIFGTSLLNPNLIATFLRDFPINQWKHVVISYNGSSKASGIKLYFNGSLQNLEVADDNLISSAKFNTGNLRLGSTSRGNKALKGSIGDVRIYNKALSQAEALQNFYSEQSKYFQGLNIVSLSPTDNATGVVVQSDLVIEFDQIISKGTGNIRIKKTSNIPSVETIEVGSDRVKVSGMTATINPLNNLIGGNSYFIEIDQDAFKYNGVSFPGISGSDTWNFSTVSDSTAPRVTALSPENGSQDAPVASDLVVTFDETVYPGSEGINIFNIDNDGPAVFVETINVQNPLVTGAGTNMITINPSNFSSNSSYLVTFDSPAFQDGAGNNYKSIDPWIFSTADTTPISVTNLSPADDATNVPIRPTLQIKFNKIVISNSGFYIFIKKAADDSGALIKINDSEADTYTVNLPFDLTENTQYYINIAPNSFKDKSGNQFSGITDKFTWSFKTTDITAPIINTLSPSDNATMVNLNSDLVLVFNEPVLAKAGNISLRKVTAVTDEPVETIDVTGPLVMVTGTDTITINPAKDFQEDTKYYLNIDATAFTDLGGNAFSGISDKDRWNFQTIDLTLPIITGLSPTDNSVGININSNLDVTFSEPIVKRRGNINIFNSANNTLVESIDVTSNTVTVTGNKIVINPSMDLAEGTDYFITIAQGAFADLNENAFSGILNNVNWNFKTVLPTGGNVPTGGSVPFVNSGCSFTRCGDLCCIVGCCPTNQGTCIDFPNCFASSSSSGSSNISSSSSGSFSPSSSSSSSSSSSGGLSFNSDGSLSNVISPVTITGPTSIKLPANKTELTVSHTKVENEIKCSVIPLGDIQVSVKPNNISFTPAKDKTNIKLKIKSTNIRKTRKAPKDKSEKNVQIKVLCDDGEGNLDIKILP